MKKEKLSDKDKKWHKKAEFKKAVKQKEEEGKRRKKSDAQSDKALDWWWERQNKLPYGEEEMDCDSFFSDAYLDETYLQWLIGEFKELIQLERHEIKRLKKHEKLGLLGKRETKRLKDLSELEEGEIERLEKQRRIGIEMSIARRINVPSAADDFAHIEYSKSDPEKFEIKKVDLPDQSTNKKRFLRELYEHPAKKMNPEQALRKHNRYIRNWRIYIEYRYLLEEKGMKKIHIYLDLALNHYLSQGMIKKIVSRFSAA